jgi:hypothetical protein
MSLMNMLLKGALEIGGFTADMNSDVNVGLDSNGKPKVGVKKANVNMRKGANSLQLAVSFQPERPAMLDVVDVEVKEVKPKAKATRRKATKA